MPKKLVKAKSYDERQSQAVDKSPSRYKLRSVVEEIKKQQAQKLRNQNSQVQVKRGRGRPKGGRKLSLNINSQQSQDCQEPSLSQQDIFPVMQKNSSLSKDEQIKQLEDQIQMNAQLYQQKLKSKDMQLQQYIKKNQFLCQVCLEYKDFKHLGSINSCVSHQFCCVCLVSWGLHQNRCPTCKQRFTMLAPAIGVQSESRENRAGCLTEQFNFYERDICPASSFKQQLTCKKTQNLLKIVYGQSYGENIGIFEMSRVRDGNFAFSYKEKNKREVSIKNVKITDQRAQATFDYNKAKYELKFYFDGEEMIMLTTMYETDEFGQFLEVYAIQEDKTLKLHLFKIVDGNKFIIHQQESEITTIAS